MLEPILNLHQARYRIDAAIGTRLVPRYADDE